MQEKIVFKDKEKQLVEFVLTYVNKTNNEETRKNLMNELCNKFKSLFPGYIDEDGRINSRIEIQTFII